MINTFSVTSEPFLPPDLTSDVSDIAVHGTDEDDWCLTGSMKTNSCLIL